MWVCTENFFDIINWKYKDRGTQRFDVAIITDGKEVWKKTHVEIEWVQGPSSVRIRVPPHVDRIDTIRLEITKCYRTSAGLAEIQVLKDDKNLATGCRIETDSKYRLKPNNLTDGILVDSGDGKGY